ncbi:mobile mystery protein A [Sphingobacterium sp. DN00404]|uniref:Mobile mystery protein A n=1 Tax=Sphingobacterium micropteri TaxID=2763501 RepID=A0ABR7YKA4_9SPHI|nr:mobile mystery protein A [Sphingobacterium micropteri]MBD1431760.1 mobile mystery protein A [Sphingobacterium micropteri]
MEYWDRKLMREQLDKKLKKLSILLSPELPERGWVKLIREALGMSGQELGKRIGLNQSSVSRLESSELSGDAKLSSLKKTADALNMKFVYGFVPRDGLENMVKRQAQKIAQERMAKASHTMLLEAQELSDEEKARMFDDLVQKILIEQPKDFWER